MGGVTVFPTSNNSNPGPATSLTWGGLTGSILDQTDLQEQFNSTYGNIEDLVASISSGGGGVMYDTLAAAQALGVKPSNGTVFQVSIHTDTVNAGLYTFQSSNPGGTRLELRNARVDLGKNLFNSATNTAFILNSTTGAATADADSSISDYISVTPGVIYTISGRTTSSSNNTLVFYDVNKTILPPLGANYNAYPKNGAVIAPATARFVRFCTILNGSGSSAAVQFEEGANATTYAAFSPSISFDTFYTQEETDTNFAPLKPVRKNLFNSGSLVAGFLNGASGALQSLANSYTSAYIEVEPSTAYYLSGRDLVGTKGVAFYTEGMVILSPLWATYEAPTANLTFTTPATAKYVRFTVQYNGTGTTNNIQFELGTKETYYETFITAPEYKVPASYIPELRDGTLKQTITIANSDKITVFGNSYTQGYCMHKKHYLDSLSMFSDYQFRNFGKAGDDLLEILERVRNDETTIFGSIPVSQWGTTYGIIANRDNNALMYTANIDTFYETAKKLAIAIETLGAKPILSTEHHEYDWLMNSFQRLSNEKGYMFMNWGRVAEKLRNGVFFAPIYYNLHPSTRTHWLWTTGMKKYIDSLPRVDKGIKLFRVRPDINTADLQNLVYENIVSRAERFEEFVIGQSGLSQATENKFDRLNTTEAIVTYTDEYLKIQNNTSVTVGNHLLVEIILPYTADNLESLSVQVATTGVSAVYIKKTLDLSSYLIHVGDDPAYLADFEDVVGEWEAVTFNDGLIEIDPTLFQYAINYDKLSLLFVGTAITLSDISAECIGSKTKDRSSKPVPEIKTGTELLTDTLLNAGSSWVSIASVSTVAQVVNGANTESFPSGITTVREITLGGTSLKQALTSVADDYHVTRAQIRIICRYFPEYCDSDVKAAASVIKRGSYDCANMSVSIINGSNSPVRVGVEQVGLYWQEVIMDAILDTGSNSIEITTRDKNIQVAKVNVIKYT